MKRKINLVLVFLCCTTFLFGQEKKGIPYAIIPIPEDNDSLKKVWEKVMYFRMKKIEEKTGLKFAENFFPQIQFGLPDIIADSKNAGACYYQKTHSFWIKENNKTLCWAELVGDSAILDSNLQRIFDHELGHALVDQISHRVNGHVWPDSSLQMWNSLSYSDRLGRILLAEGTAEYFNRVLSGDTFMYAEILPNSGDELSFSNSFMWSWRYYGGYWLVRPIIDKYGENGIVYITNHPLKIKENRIRDACIVYQKKALKVLSRKKAH